MAGEYTVTVDTSVMVPIDAWCRGLCIVYANMWHALLCTQVAVAAAIIGGGIYLWQSRRRRRQLQQDRATFMLLADVDSDDDEDEIFHL
jgi:hypothetical protein